MMKFILATTNKNKLSEINAIAKDYGINFELPQVSLEVDEDGQTLYENALKKAEFYLKKYSNLYGSTSFHLQEELFAWQSQAIASESKTSNNPLKWKTEPETECKDYAEPNNLELEKQDNYYILSDDTGLFVEVLNGVPGIHSARYDTTPEKRIQKLLNALKDENNRNAKFLCTMVLLNSNGEILMTNTGEIKGTITKSTKGLNGFGYDPIFFIENLNKTMAQLSKEEKNTISHRAKALIPILKYIKTNIL